MDGVSNSPREASPGVRGADPLVLGTLYCTVSALGYTAANLCLCSLANVADQVWTLWVKESVTVAVVGPWLLYQVVRGRYALPSVKAIAVMATVGAAVQLLGNLNMLGAFGVVGLAVTVPLVYAVNLAGTAILGRAVLGERVTLRSALAIGSLIASITLLNLGAGSDGRVSVEELGNVRMAVAAACLAGAVYAVMTISIRKSVAGVMPLPMVVLIIPAMGTLTLGPLGLWRQGIQGLLSVQPQHFGLMLLAGTLNLVAFLSYTKALRVITALEANVVNAAQVAMAAVGGVLFFSEPPSGLLALGVALTILGIFLIERPARAYQGPAVACNRRPSARTTRSTVANSGLPSDDNAL